MDRQNRFRSLRLTLGAALLLVSALATTLSLTGCFVAGYSSRGGGFIWPGGFGLFFMLLLVFFLMRRRR